MTLAQINSFDTNDPDKLSRQLSDFEDRVHNEFVSTRAAATPNPTLQTRVSLPAPKPASFALQPDEQTSFDTLMGNLTGVLPPVSPANFGKRFIVLKRFGANTVSVTCQDPSTKLNGSAAFPLAITVAGATIFFCDAAGYYK